MTHLASDERQKWGMARRKLWRLHLNANVVPNPAPKPRSQFHNETISQGGGAGREIFGPTPLRATPLRRELGIIPSAHKTRNSLLLDSLLFDNPSLCTVQHVLGDSFFFFEPPPPTANPCVLGLGVGVMGNAGLCSRSAHGLQVPSSFLYILVHLKGLVK